MKRIPAILTALALLSALTGCSGAGKSSGGPADSLPLTEVRQSQMDGDLTLTAEWPSYASLDSVVYVLLENNTDETVSTGSHFSLEVDLGAGGEFSWFRLETKPDTGWTAIGYEIQPGGSMAFACHLSAYETSFLTGGHFRIVKEIGGKVCAAEFTVSEDAPVSDQRPYGFAALEDLPADYSAEDAAADGCVVFRAGEEAANVSAIGMFLEKVRLGIPCRLRTVRTTTEGAPVLEDITYEEVGNTGRFAWQRDDSRDGMDAHPHIGPVLYYSFLQTDGWYISLSNALKWDHSYGQPSLELLAGEEAEPYIPAVQALTDSALLDNVTRCRVWSPDGTRYASLTEDPLEFAYGDAGYGIVHSLAEYDGLEQEIQGIGWLDHRTVILRVRELDPLNSQGTAAVRLWDCVTEKLTTGPAEGLPSTVDPRDM